VPREADRSDQPQRPAAARVSAADGIAPDVPPRALLFTVRLIDRVIGEWSGRVFCWMIIPLVGGLTYEVFVRYLFNAPTIWAYDVTYMLYGAHFMLGAAYTLYKGGHIRTDIWYANWSPRTQGAVDALLYLCLFFPAMFFFLTSSWEEALVSINVLETSDASPWRPPLYPFKTVIPVAAALLLVQGVSEFLKSVYAAWRGRWL
jgi:TRAP-type mannitol/chloroaromatic compound transport system permease small subunit